MIPVYSLLVKVGRRD
ncbi:CD1375 family protein [Brevibacillus sp. SKDU10]